MKQKNHDGTRGRLSGWAAVGLGLMFMTVAAFPARAHVGVVNLQTPYAVAGKSYELVLAVPHGCAYTNASGQPAEADVFKLEIDMPPGFAGARPIIDPVWGRPAMTKDAQGQVVKMTWTKAATFDAAEDDQSYRIAVRGTVPNAPFTTMTFATRQHCRNPAGGADLVVDWSAYGTPATNESPKVRIMPPRAPGWNTYTLAAANEKHTPAAVKALLTEFFADAQIVWLMPGTNTGKGAWSANTATMARIAALMARDPNVYELTTKPDVMIHATDVIWAKF